MQSFNARGRERSSGSPRACTLSARPKARYFNLARGHRDWAIVLSRRHRRRWQRGIRRDDEYRRKREWEKERRALRCAGQSLRWSTCNAEVARVRNILGSWVTSELSFDTSSRILAHNVQSGEGAALGKAPRILYHILLQKYISITCHFQQKYFSFVEY